MFLVVPYVHSIRAMVPSRSPFYAALYARLSVALATCTRMA